MRARSSFLLLSAFMTLKLTACGSSDSALGDQPTLTGQLDGWNRGTGFTLQVSVLRASSPPLSTVIASAPIDAAGNFSITLPGSATLTPLLTAQHVDQTQMLASCSGNVQVTPSDFAAAAAFFTAVNGTSALSVTLGNGVSGNTSGLQIIAGYTYVDRDFSEVGTLACNASGAMQQSTADVHLKTGWNREVLSLMLDTAAGMITSSTSTGPLPDGVKWMFK